MVRAAWGKLAAPRRAREVETGRTRRGREENGELGGKEKNQERKPQEEENREAF